MRTMADNKLQKYFTWGYLILICTLLPLYMQNGYYKLGEAKGIAFMVMGGIFAVGTLALLIKDLPSVLRAAEPVDYAVLVFLFSNVLTFIFSIDKKTGFFGLEGWRMGFLSYFLMIVGFYGFKEGIRVNKLILASIFVAPAAEFVLGILNRFGIYPMEIYGRDTSFLATIGNINWYVGFLSIFVPLGIGLGYTRRIFSRGFFFMAGFTLMGLVILFLQGSDSGLLVAIASYLLLLFVSLEIRDGFKRFLLQLMILGLAMEVVCILMLLIGKMYNYDQSIVMWVTEGHKGLIVLALGFFLYRLSRFFEEIKGKWRGKLFLEFLVGVLIVGAIVIIIFAMGPVDYSFGNGRGVIWSISLDLFKELSPWQKLTGSGHDCFYNFAYSNPEIAGSLLEIFDGNRLTNAHCELLTILIEHGLFGLFSYLLLIGASLHSFWKNKRKSAAVICALPVFAYFINGLVSFSTPISTPYLFIMLGVGAHYCRKRD